MATGNNKVTTPIKEVNGKLVIGQGIDAFQVAVTKDGKLAVEDPTTRIAGHYPDMYPWNAPEGYPDMAISFAKDGSYPPDNIPVSCLPGAIRALKQLVLHTSTGVDTPPVDDPQTSLAPDVEDGDLVVIAADGLWHKATVPSLEEPTPPAGGDGEEGTETPPTENVALSGIWREFSPETYKLATMMLFSGVYIERLGQVVTNNYVTHSDWSFDSGAVLYLDTDNPGKLTTADTGYPVGSAQLVTDYGTTVYLDPFLWGIERGVAEALRLSNLVVGNMEATSKALQEQIDDVSEKQRLHKEAQDLVNTELRESVASLDTHQQELNQAVATIQGRQDTLEEQHEALEETQAQLDQKLETKFTEVTTKIEEQKTVIETVTSGSRGFWYPEEPIGFTPIDTSRFLVLGDVRDKVLVDMALKVLPSNTPDVYVREVTYDSLTGFTTVAVTSPYAEGDKSFYYGLPKEVMPKIEAEGGSGPVDPSDIPNIPADKLPDIPADKLPDIPADKLPDITGDMLPEVPVEKLPEIPVEKLPAGVVTSPDDLPNASADVRGLVKLDGVTTTIDENGNLKAVYTAEDGTIIETPPIATEQVAGIMRPDGETTFVSPEGVLSAKGNLTLDDLPLASEETAGLVKVDGSSIQVSPEGVLSAHAESVIVDPVTATTETLGLVKPDGSTITVTEDGTISAAGSALPDMIPVNKLPMATFYSAGIVTTAERIESGGMGVVTSDLAHTESQRLEELIQSSGGSSGVPVATNKVLGGIVLGDRLISDSYTLGKVSAAPAFYTKIKEIPITRPTQPGSYISYVDFSLSGLSVGTFLFITVPPFLYSIGGGNKYPIEARLDLTLSQNVYGTLETSHHYGLLYGRVGTYAEGNTSSVSAIKLLDKNTFIVLAQAASINGRLDITVVGLQAGQQLEANKILVYA